MPEQRFAPRRITNALDKANGLLADIPVDVEDHIDHYLVTADLPGSRTQDIEVTVNPERPDRDNAQRTDVAARSRNPPADRLAARTSQGRTGVGEISPGSPPGPHPEARGRRPALSPRRVMRGRPGPPAPLRSANA